MGKIANWLAPKDGDFFKLLNEQAENALSAAKELKEFIDNYDKIGRDERESVANSIKAIENKGDDIEDSIMRKIDKNFKTPYDKESVKQISSLLDDITDLANRCASRFFILSIERINEHVSKFAEISVKLAAGVKEIISDFDNLKKVEEHCSRIYGLENEADQLFNEALSDLFHFYKNPVDIMKYREIYETMESLADKCKDVANAVESIALRHS